MRTLSFDLRGIEVVEEPDSAGPVRGAGLSVLAHGIGLSALVLAPLMGATNPPEAALSLQEPLVRPVTVVLPPAPKPIGSAIKRSTASRAAVPAAAEPRTPVETPSVLPIGEVLDLGPSLPSGSANATGTGNDGIGVGDCVLGALCGNGPLPATTAAPPETPRVGGLIREPRLRESRAPHYPPMAQAAGVSGKVVIEAHVSVDGRIIEATVVEGNGLFNEAALTSVRSRRYEALLLNGVPTDFLVTITLVFNLRR